MTLSGIDSLPNKAILDPYGKYLTFINTFTVEPDRAEALIEALKHSTEETFRSKKGFISVNLHMSRDHKRVVNYAQWQSKEDYDPAFKTPEVSQAGNMCSGRLRAVSANSATARKRQFSDFIKAT